MEDRETARMRKYGESKTTRIMMATVLHVTSGSGLREFEADGFFGTECTLVMYEERSERKERLRIQSAQLFHCTISVMWCVQ